MKIYFSDIQTFLSEVEGPIYAFITQRLQNSFTDSLLTLSAFNRHNQAIEICEVVGAAQNEDKEAIDNLIDFSIEREKEVTDKLKEKGFRILSGTISLLPVPTDKIDEKQI